MTEEKLQEITKRFWQESEDVLGNDMIDIYAAERIIREVCGMDSME